MISQEVVVRKLKSIFILSHRFKSSLQKISMRDSRDQDYKYIFQILRSQSIYEAILKLDQNDLDFLFECFTLDAFLWTKDEANFFYYLLHLNEILFAWTHELNTDLMESDFSKFPHLIKNTLSSGFPLYRGLSFDPIYSKNETIDKVLFSKSSFYLSYDKKVTSWSKSITCALKFAMRNNYGSIISYNPELEEIVIDLTHPVISKFITKNFQQEEEVILCPGKRKCEIETFIVTPNEKIT